MPLFQTIEPVAPVKGSCLVAVDGRVYPLRSARIAADASGGLVRSTLVQTYSNPYAETLEVVYTMPLPADGAVVGYSMCIGDRIIRGEVRPKAEARVAYERALFDGRSAALLEQERDDTFTQRLGALPAGVDAEITIEMLHPLGFVVGPSGTAPQWEYRFPTVVGVRYQGAPGRVDDAERLTADRAEEGGIPARIELKLHVLDGDGNETHRVESMPLDRDLVVRWPAGGAEVGAQVIEGKGLPGDDGRYGLVTIVPPAAPQAVFPRDLTILIDASGSMSGAPIEWAKSVAKGLLLHLSDQDRFEVIAFADRPQKLTKGIVAASSKNIGAAIDAVDRVRAAGGTEMVDAVVAALPALRFWSQRQVVLITDGQIGFEAEVVRKIRDRMSGQSRLHVVGVGAAPNRTLTARAARAGGGIECFVCGQHEVDAATRTVVAATAWPLLTDVRITGSALHAVAPASPRDVLAGRPSISAVELKDEGGILDVSGTLAGVVQRWVWAIDVPPVAERAGAMASVPVGALYGRERIADLESEGDPRPVRVEQIAMRHKIASSATSFVAFAVEPTVDPRDPRRRVVLPVEVPAFQSAPHLGLDRRRTLASSLLQASRMRFRLSEEARAALDVDNFGEPEDEAGLLSEDRLSVVEEIGEIMRHAPRTPELRGRVIELDGDVLVVEYEHPGGKVEYAIGDRVIWMGAGPGDAEIDWSRSTPRGTYPAGMLRLALRLEGGWPVGTEVTLVWPSGRLTVLVRVS